MFMKTIALLTLTFAVSTQALAEGVSMTEGQRAELAKVAPGLTITPELAQKLRATAYDQSLSIPERVEAIRRLAGYPDGEMIKRTICIWDIAGRSGPIYAAAQDQRSQIMQYGVEVDMVPYTSETVLAEDLKSGRCDAGLMTGLRARLFTATAAPSTL